MVSTGLIEHLMPTSRVKDRVNVGEPTVLIGLDELTNATGVLTDWIGCAAEEEER